MRLEVRKDLFYYQILFRQESVLFWIIVTMPRATKGSQAHMLSNQENIVHYCVYPIVINGEREFVSTL